MFLLGGIELFCLVAQGSIFTVAVLAPDHHADPRGDLRRNVMCILSNGL
jgi:hypothetical protein